MKKLRFKKIDAFASDRSAGNPAAVVYLDRLEELSDDEKIRVAKELKGFVSEVGYVCPGTETDFELRYFSSEREVAFCGHATIAIMNDIVAGDEALSARTTLTIATRTDRLQVENRYRNEKGVYISAPPPRYSSEEFGAADVAAALNSRLEDLDPSRPIRMINAGLETLVVPMAGLDAILRATPDLQSLNAFCLRSGVDIVLLYSSEVSFPECRYRTRVFAAPFGYLEDPATGSGNSAFGNYLLAHGMWNGDSMKIEQNGFRDAPNFVRLYSPETRSADSRVWFGGGAIVRIDGCYHLG